MESVIRLEDKYYILATSARTDLRTNTIKYDETFAVVDRFGDILMMGMGEQGIYHLGTRHISTWELLVEDQRPFLLSSGAREDNHVLSSDLTNTDMMIGKTFLPRESIHLHRSKFLWKGNCFEGIYLINFGMEPIAVRISLLFDADFKDVFEVRGIKRTRRGEYLAPHFWQQGITLRYMGLDDVERSTRITFSHQPASLEANKATFEFHLTPRQRQTFRITMQFDHKERIHWEDAFILSSETSRAMKARACQACTGNEQFNTWFNTSMNDTHMMLTHTKYGIYPYAGVPWFNAAFGRDGIITALECLWFEPEIAKDVLQHLAANQAVAVIHERDAEPGKIIHEVRFGEMAALGEIPFGKYYGSVDSTPLFIYLAGAYYRRTGDLELIRTIWSNLKMALQWIDNYGDLDGDGFIEYRRRSERGLRNQGWKDSGDSVFHADGAIAEGPIALCEVQGYVYAAKMEAALLASLLGDEQLARRLEQEAESLRKHFEESFWADEIDMYAIALDGKKKPCKVRTSNAGQCIFTGIASEERVYRMTDILLSPDFFSGWGIRTVASTEARYNPMSYHNGSIWPHDNAMIAMGFARYGLRDALMKVFKGLFDATKFFDQHRLPELFCGFHRRIDSGPTAYPVACSPQAWASGAIFMLLAACLGLHLEQPNRVVLKHTTLPEFLSEVGLSGLKVKDAEADLILRRYRYNVGVEIVRKTGDVEVLVIK
ncbi:MAG TPA: amylo-alpha-1,6-glucosidase [Dissulfurispiraceae bacterium]